jgi:phage host-nuclease inhibitor protein Gam
MDVLELVAAAEAADPYADYQDTEDEKVTGAWAIETVTSLDWALSCVAASEAEAREADAMAKAAKARIDAKAAQMKAAAERRAGFFRFKIEEYAERNRETLLGGGKKKSRTLLHGTIGWRSSQERIVVTDPQALEAWLVTQPVERGLFRQTIAPDLKALQALFQASGEVPPGCDTKPAADELYVKADAPTTAIVKG